MSKGTKHYEFASLSNDVCRLALHLAQQADGSMKLEIVEMNRFKHLVHLALLCARPSEEQLRRHLAALINNLKVVLVSRRNNQMLTQDQLRNSEMNCQRMKDEHAKGHKALKERNAQCERLKQQYKVSSDFSCISSSVANLMLVHMHASGKERRERENFEQTMNDARLMAPVALVGVVCGQFALSSARRNHYSQSG